MTDSQYKRVNFDFKNTQSMGVKGECLYTVERKL